MKKTLFLIFGILIISGIETYACTSAIVSAKVEIVNRNVGEKPGN